MNRQESFLYMYAHRALRILALVTPEVFYSKLSSQRSLLDNWDFWAESAGTSHPPDGLEFSRTTLRQGTELFLIRMPKPRAVPEAVYVAVAFDVEKQLLRTEVLSARYFTLELGRDVTGQTEAYFFCEWTLATGLQHVNYGILSDSSEQSFIDAIEGVLGESSGD